MLNIEHLLMKQKYFALEEISTVFLAIGFAQYTIYHFLLIYNRVVDKMKVVYPFYESVIIKKPKKVNV